MIAAERAAGKYILTGTINTYSYEQVIDLQGAPDPNAAYGGSQAGRTWNLFVLDSPVQLNGNTIDGLTTTPREVKMIVLGDSYTAYNGQHVTISVSPYDISFPSDASMPLGQPSGSISVLG